MSAEKISMRKIKEILRLKFESKLTNRQIARSLNVSPGTVCRYLQEATTKGVTWPLPENLDEQALGSVLLIMITAFWLKLRLIGRRLPMKVEDPKWAISSAPLLRA